MADEPDFKVVDRRGQQRAETPKEPEQKGDGFTMHEAPGETATAPHQVDFATLVLSFATSALIQMGVAPDPATGEKVKDLALARQNIDILEILEKKTKGNLTRDEQALIDGVLTEVRLRFVEAAK